MPRTKAPERLTASLLQIQDKPELYLDQVIWVPTEELIDAHHPANPRVHREDEDIPEIFKSLLWFGWGVVGVTFNPVTGLITGGHGRNQAADLGRKMDPDEFEARWEQWLKQDKDRKEVAAIAKQRFCPEYWEYCPTYVCMLTGTDQKTLMVRLNDQQKDGKNDPSRMAALLAQLPKSQVPDTGWDVVSAEAFKTAFLELPKASPPEPEGYNFDAGEPPSDEVEYEGGQHFESADATDYGEPDYEEEDSFDESGPVRVTTADGEDVAIAEVGELKEEFEVGQVNYDKDVRETRAVLLMSRVQLDRFKSFFGTTTCPGPVIALLERLGVSIDMAQSIKEWRPDANLAVLEMFLKQNQALYDQILAEQEQDQPTEDD